jgi:hypothetical protein
MAVAALGIASAARADEAADQAKRDAARALFAQGVKLTESGDNAGALAAFRSAYEKSPSFRVLYNIGQLCSRLFDPVCAVRAYDQYLSDGGSDIPTKRRAEVEGEMQRLRRSVGTVTVTVNVPGANITVDDTAAGHAPLPSPIIVAPGSHKFVAALEGKTADRTVRVSAGEAATVELQIAGESTPEPAPATEPSPSTTKKEEPKPPPPAPKKKADSGGLPVVPWAITGGLVIATTVTGIFAATSYSSYTAKKASFPVTRADLDDAQGSARTLFLVTGAFATLTVAALAVSGYFTFLKPVGAGPRVHLGTGTPPPRSVALGLSPGGVGLTGVLP